MQGTVFPRSPVPLHGMRLYWGCSSIFDQTATASPGPSWTPLSCGHGFGLPAVPLPPPFHCRLGERSAAWESTRWFTSYALLKNRCSGPAFPQRAQSAVKLVRDREHDALGRSLCIPLVILPAWRGWPSFSSPLGNWEWVSYVAEYCRVWVFSVTCVETDFFLWRRREGDS